MKTASILTATLLVPLLQIPPAGAYPKAYAPFAPGKEPPKVPLRECVLVRQTISDEGQSPMIQVFGVSKAAKSPLIQLQRSESGWSITMMGKDGAPLLAQPETSEMTYLPHVYTADLNGDGAPDFVVNIWSGGCGIAGEGSTTTFLLSSGDKYNAQSFYGFDFGLEDLIRLKRNGPCYFIHTQFIGNGSERTRDGAEHNFWVYQLYRIDRARLVCADADGPRFPRWIWYTFKDNHRETDQLTSEQKSRLLKEHNARHWP